MTETKPDIETVIAGLKARFGDRCSTVEAIREQHGHDESWNPVYPPDAVVFVESTEEVSAVVGLCAAHRVPVIPFGAGSSLEGQVAAVQGGVSIDLSHMTAILAVRPEDMDATVQAGVTRQALNRHLRDTGLFFPIDPGAEATLGGMAATRASGTNAVRYGTMKDVVLALTVVLADGRVIRTGRRAKKTATGYDLTRLFIGSEGTLGIITELTVRLFGIPETVIAAVCHFETLRGAIDTVIQTMQMGVPMSRIELLDDVQVDAINRYSKMSLPLLSTLFLEFAGGPEAVREQVVLVEALARENGGGAFHWAERSEEREALWRARHHAAYAALALRPGCKGLATDVCVPISRLADCILETKQDLEGSILPAPLVGHVGDGNFHLMIVFDPEIPDEIREAERISERLAERAIAMDGTCTGEHGIGLGKAKFLRAELGDAVDAMLLIKHALDPHRILNPGKIFEAERPHRINPGQVAG